MAKRINKRTTTTTTTTENTVTAIYCRVSTETQVSDGFGLDAQREKCLAYCVAKGWTVEEDRIYVDAAISGTSTDGRDAFNQMMEDAKEGRVNRIVTAKLDRIARNVRDFANISHELDRVGCGVIMIAEDFDTSTPMGKAMLHLSAVFAEMEVDIIKERTMSGKRQNAAQGGYNGSGKLLGYDYTNGEFKANRDAETVRFIFDSFCKGTAMSRIATELNDGGNPTAKGGKWYAGTVRYILTNGFYAGLTQYDGTEVKGSHPAIIDVNQYHAAIQRLRSIKPGPRAK